MVIDTLYQLKFRRKKMNQEQINSALRLTIQELTSSLSEEKTSKNLIAVQLAESNQQVDFLNQQNAELQARVIELEALLDEQTKPEEIIEGE